MTEAKGAARGKARVVHCWEDGPRDEADVGSTCMLLDGHGGPHEWTSDARIGLQFAESEASAASARNAPPCDLCGADDHREETHGESRAGSTEGKEKP